MGFTVKFSDVTKYKGDAVVNSLGTEGSVYGSICKSIVEKAKDESIKALIDSIKYGEPLDMFVTPGGKLKAANIIHIVTPRFLEDDDYDGDLLFEAYQKIIEKAINCGFKTIGIPFIGTGANGYSESMSYKMLTKACAEIVEQEEIGNREIIDITILAYLNKEPTFRARNYNEYLKHSGNRVLECCKAPSMVKYERPKVEEKKELTSEEKTAIREDITYKMAHFMSHMKYENYVAPPKSIDNPFDFFEMIAAKNDISNSDMISLGLNTKKKHQIKKKVKSITKINVYRLAFIAQMNRTELIEFMSLCGVSFSPLSELDRFFYHYATEYVPKFVEKKYEIIEEDDDYYDENVIENLYNLDDYANNLGYRLEDENIYFSTI